MILFQSTWLQLDISPCSYQSYLVIVLILRCLATPFFYSHRLFLFGIWLYATKFNECIEPLMHYWNYWMDFVVENIIIRMHKISRHTVVCQRPRKLKKTCSTQVYYLPVPQSCQIQPSVSPKLLSWFLPDLYIFCLTYTLLHISNFKEIALAVLEMFVPKNNPIFFTFFFTQNYKYI